MWLALAAVAAGFVSAPASAGPRDVVPALAFDPPPPVPIDDIVAPDAPRDDALAIGFTLWIESVGVLSNLRLADTPGRRAARTAVGAIGGYVGIVVGIAEMSDDQGSPAWGSACMGIGAVSLGLAVRQALSKRPPKREPAVIEAGLWQSRDGVPGLALSVRY
jgi:hypothetical protein